MCQPSAPHDPEHATSPHIRSLADPNISAGTATTKLRTPRLAPRRALLCKKEGAAAKYSCVALLATKLKRAGCASRPSESSRLCVSLTCATHRRRAARVSTPPCGLVPTKPRSERIPFQRTGEIMIKPAFLVQAWALKESIVATFIPSAVAPANRVADWLSKPPRGEQLHIPAIDQTSRVVVRSPWTI